MLREQARVAAIGFHRGDSAIKTGDDLLVLGVFQADQNMQTVLAQRLGQEFDLVTDLSRLARMVIKRHVLVLDGQLVPSRRQHAHRHGKAVYRDLLQIDVVV